MMFRFLRPILASLGALAATFSFALDQIPGQYHEVPGSLEFTGELMVRPLQTATLREMGVPAALQAQIQLRARSRMNGLTVEYVSATDEYVIKVPQGENENSFSVKLMRTGDYQYAAPNWRVYPVGDPNDQLYSQQWHHPKTSSPLAWDLVTGDNSVIVGIVDTGVDVNHPDIAPNRVLGYNSVDRLAEANGGQVMDINGHGTHTTGDAGAVGNNTIGVSGMGWNFRTMMCRTSNSPGGSASFDDLLDGARYAAAHGCRIVSVSYSGVDFPQVGTTGTFIKTNNNALLFWAAGNDNRDLSGLSFPDVIVVGASDENDNKAGFSAYGTGVHVFAPGTNVVSTTLGGGYGGSSGTSMACPVAAGAGALIMCANPGLSAQEVQDILEANCDFIGDPNIFGHGRVNQYRNVLAALSATPIDVLPNGISVYEGTYQGGTLADILNPNSGGPTYNLKSVKSGKLGQVAGVIVTFHLNTTQTNLRSLEFSFQAKESPLTIVTGFVYLWNYGTARWDLFGQTPLKNSFSMFTKKITSNPSRYMNAGGDAKALYRAVSSSAPGKGRPFPFVLNFAYAHLRYTEAN